MRRPALTDPLRPARLTALFTTVFSLAVLLKFSTAAQHPQQYLVCKDIKTDVCLTWPKDHEDALRFIRSINPDFDYTRQCGFSQLSVLSPHQRFITVAPINDESANTIFCKIDKIIEKHPNDWMLTNMANSVYRARRQTPYSLRGRYRGQTQSQYLAIDHGNGKDEGKAEAHSAADSSRASVSGSSGMGQAQSQTMYDPSCDNCVGRAESEAESLKRRPYDSQGGSSAGIPIGGSNLPGTGSYGINSGGRPGTHGSYGPNQGGRPGESTLYGPNVNGHGGYGPNLNGDNGNGALKPNAGIGSGAPGTYGINQNIPGGSGEYGPSHGMPNGGGTGGVAPSRNGIYGASQPGVSDTFQGGFPSGTNVHDGAPGGNVGYSPHQVGADRYPSNQNGIPHSTGTGNLQGGSPGGNGYGTNLGGGYSPPNQLTMPGYGSNNYGPGQHVSSPSGSDIYGPSQSGVPSSPNGKETFGPGQNNLQRGNGPYGPNQIGGTGDNRGYGPTQGGLPATGYVPGQQGTSQLQPGQQGTSQLQPGQQGTSQLQPGQQGTSQLQPGQIGQTASNGPYGGQNWPSTRVFSSPDGTTYYCCVAGPNNNPQYFKLDGNGLPTAGTQTGTPFGTTGQGSGSSVPQPLLSPTGPYSTNNKPFVSGSGGSNGPYGSYSTGPNQGNAYSGPYSPVTHRGSDSLPQTGGQYRPGIRDEHLGSGGTGPYGLMPSGGQSGITSPGDQRGLQGPGGIQGQGGLQGPGGFQGQGGSQGPGGLPGQGLQGPGGLQGQGGLQGPGSLQIPGGQGGSQGPGGLQGQGGLQGPGGLQGQGGLQGPGGLQGQGGLQGPGGLQGQGGLQGPGGLQGQGGLQGPGGLQGQGGLQGPGGLQGQGGLQGPGSLQGQGSLQGPGGLQGQGGLQSPGGLQGPGGMQGQGGFHGPGGYQGPGGLQGQGSVQGPGGIISGQNGVQGLSSGGIPGQGGVQTSPGVIQGQGGLQGPGALMSPGSQLGTGSLQGPGGIRGPGQYGSISPGGGSGLQGPGGDTLHSPHGQYSPGTINGQNNLQGPSGGINSGQNGLQVPGGSYGSGPFTGQGGPQGTNGQYGPGSTVGQNGLPNQYIPGTIQNGYGTPTGTYGTYGPGTADRQNGQSPYGAGQNIGPGGTGPYGNGQQGELPGGQTGAPNQYGTGQGAHGPQYGNGMTGTGQYGNGYYGYNNGKPDQNGDYAGIPQNVIDPNSIGGPIDGDDSEAEASVSQAANGTVATASSKGGNDKGRAQTHVHGAYTDSGSFSAQAEISGENKAANSEVTGNKKGASSNAQGSGRNNKSQANVQLGSETGSVLTGSQSQGTLHSSNTQVQGSVKGGMADAQARGPGSTSSQAQIGFTPYKEGDKSHDLQKAPFIGGGTASAQSSGRTGSSQSQLRGTFKYGITYNGGAQAGASLDKDTVFPNRLPFDKIDVYDESNKNINVISESTEKSAEPVTENYPYSEAPPVTDNIMPVNQADTIPSTEIPFNPVMSTERADDVSRDSEIEYGIHTHSDHHKTDVEPPMPTRAPPVESRRSFHSTYSTNSGDYEYTTDKDENSPDDYDVDDGFGPEGTDATDVEQGEYSTYNEFSRDTEPTHQNLNSPRRKGLEVRQTTGGNTQHIVLGSLNNHDAEITQRNSERPDESRVYQPGERVPGTGGYTIPVGFTGSVKSVASKDKTYVVGSKDSPSQAQTVSLTPGRGKVKYTYPANYARNINPKNLRSLYQPKPDDSNRYVSVSKSVTRDLDAEDHIRKQYSHTYYTKSSSCGYFTFTCTMVSGAEGRKKVCKPKIPTNPDGTPMRC